MTAASTGTGRPCADAVARELLAGQAHLPRPDLHAVARGLGVRRIATATLAGARGHVVRQPGGWSDILLAPGLSAPDRRMTLAHEIAHLALADDLALDGTGCTGGSGAAPARLAELECLCDDIARRLVAPTPLVRSTPRGLRYLLSAAEALAIPLRVLVRRVNEERPDREQTLGLLQWATHGGRWYLAHTAGFAVHDLGDVRVRIDRVDDVGCVVATVCTTTSTRTWYAERHVTVEAMSLLLRSPLPPPPGS